MACQSYRSDAWLEEFVLRHQNRILRAALAILGCRADAEDIVQEAFVRVVEKHPSFQSPEHEKAWLLRVTVNLCRDRLRNNARRRTLPLLASYPAQAEDEQSLLAAVLALPPHYRAVIHLFYYEGYRTAEIARITGQKDGTVRSLLARARQKLKNHLEDDER
ncbi:MAG: RNA polymerase sigma factor [bacterium]